MPSERVGERLYKSDVELVGIVVVAVWLGAEVFFAVKYKSTPSRQMIAKIKRPPRMKKRFEPPLVCSVLPIVPLAAAISVMLASLFFISSEISCSKVSMLGMDMYVV